MVWALAVTETISYGILYYSFAAFLLPMQQSLGFSQTTLTGAFSLSVLVTGAGAIPAGAWLDRHGVRALMTAGSLLAAGCSRAEATQQRSMPARPQPPLVDLHPLEAVCGGALTTDLTVFYSF
jgi:MFS family permease